MKKGGTDGGSEWTEFEPYITDCYQRSWRISIEPLGKPRMTRADAWKKRPCVERYYAFKDKLKSSLCLDVLYAAHDKAIVGLEWVAHIKMPKSWSKKKRNDLEGKLHRQKPDADNIEKAILDSILDDDSGVAYTRGLKLWAVEPGLELRIYAHRDLAAVIEDGKEQAKEI